MVARPLVVARSAAWQAPDWARGPVLTPARLVIALVLAAPALWESADGSPGLGPALLRLVAALVLVAIDDD